MSSFYWGRGSIVLLFYTTKFTGPHAIPGQIEQEDKYYLVRIRALDNFLYKHIQVLY